MNTERLGLLLLLCAAGCATPEHAGFGPVAQTARERAGLRLAWHTGGEPDGEVAQATRELLASELSVASAIQVALLNNRGLQATYEEVGISQADLVQAGLLSNPSVGGTVRVFALPPAIPGVELSVAQNILSLLAAPLRMRVARQELQQTQQRVTHEVFRVAMMTAQAFYDAAAAQAAVVTRRDIAIAAETSAEISRKQLEAGTTNALDNAMEQAMYRELRVALAEADLESVHAREELNRMMGTWGDQTRWTVAAQLPEDLPAEPDEDTLESLAMSQRLDVAGARTRVEAINRAVELWRPWMMTNVGVGALGEREPDGAPLGGPSLSFEVPIFDWGQASRARLQAQSRQAQHDLAKLAVDVRSEVRETSARVAYARRIVRYQKDQVLPLRRDIADLSLQQYNRMYVGVFQLLRARQDTIAAELTYIYALRDYWKARAELQFHVGGRLPAPTTTP